MGQPCSPFGFDLLRAGLIIQRGAGVASLGHIYPRALWLAHTPVRQTLTLFLSSVDSPKFRGQAWTSGAGR